jgi:hypothetical protein
VVTPTLDGADAVDRHHPRCDWKQSNYAPQATLCTSSNTDMSCSTLEELMWSRKSMTGILSRDQFGSDTMAGGSAVNAGILLLCLDVRATGARCDSIREEMLA